MPPTLVKLKGHIALGLSVCAYQQIKLMFLSRWITHQNITDPYFSFSLNYPPLWSYAPFKRSY